MHITKNQSIETADEKKVGKVDRIVIDPRDGEVTHVIASRGLLPDERVIPVYLLEEADDRLVLDATIDPDHLPHFEVEHVLQLDEATRRRFPAYDDPVVWHPLAGLSMTPVGAMPPVTRVERNLPDDAAALKTGADVLAFDEEKLGVVDEVITEDDNQVAALVVTSGLLGSERKLIPAHWVEQWGEDRVLLAVGAGVVENLPDYEA
jgi:sporulation protein YlmC with PRC-barrel domain